MTDYDFDMLEASAPVPPDSIVASASEAACNEGRLMVVGLDPYFGWMCCDAENKSRIDQMSYVRTVSSFGLE